jgi:hypothetical protein
MVHWMGGGKAGSPTNVLKKKAPTRGLDYNTTGAPSSRAMHCIRQHVCCPSTFAKHSAMHLPTGFHFGVKSIIVPEAAHLYVRIHDAAQFIRGLGDDLVRHIFVPAFNDHWHGLLICSKTITPRRTIVNRGVITIYYNLG